MTVRRILPRRRGSADTAAAVAPAVAPVRPAAVVPATAVVASAAAEPVGEGGRMARWALPGELAGKPPGRRTVRDGLVDVALVVFAAVWWLQSLAPTVTNPDPTYVEQIPGWALTVDPWLGAAGCLALWFRRRFPLALALVPALTVAGTVFGAVLVSVFTVAIHRGWLPAVLVTSVQAAQVLWFAIAWQPEGMTAVGFVAMLSLMLVTPLVCGLMVRFRRQLLMSMRRDAERQHERRLADARRAERARIAREMHDVLAHRISLLSVHAGALAYRSAQTERGRGNPLAVAEVADAVRVIRDNAHQALTELGEVLTVLRAGEPDDGRAAPVPVLADLPRLVEEARAAGQQITVDLDGVPVAGPLPRPQEQRTAYRVVQEGLTNARKHAPAAPVVIRVVGAPGAGLTVTVTNPLPVGPAGAEIPGAGAGLTGLAERVTLDGGTIEHGPRDRTFALTAHLPWRA